MKKKNEDVELLMASIGTGKENAVKSHDPITARVLRAEVQKKQRKGDILINHGDGYYRPDLSTIDGQIEFSRYISKYKRAALSLRSKIEAMEYAAWEALHGKG